MFYYQNMTDLNQTDSDQEVEDIVVEFEGNFDLNSVKGKELQLIGIDTEEPVLRIEKKFYKIDVKHLIGSRLILEKDSDKKLRYYGKTDKVVKARRVIMKPKEGQTSSEQDNK